MSNDAAAADAAKSSVEVALEALKPIRDIVKNWDIDISSCLEEFLRDLVGDKHAEDAMLIDRQRLDGEEVDGAGGGTQQQQQQGGFGSFSFTTAALVLDSSSRVYSRKVEYLHQLVFKALDGLAASFNEKEQKHNKNKRARAAASPEILEFQAFDPMEEFLLLDDVLPTDEAGGCRHINLPSEQQINKKKDGSSRRSSLTGPWDNVEFTRRREAGGGSASQSLKSPSASGLSLVNRTAPNNSFANVNRSSVLGSAALQTLVGSAASGTAGAHSSLRLMRMHGCTIDAAGALVMPGSHKYMTTSTNAGRENQTPANASNNMSYPALSTGNNNNTDGGGGGQNRMDIVGGLDDHDDDDGAGFAMADDDDDGGPGYAMVDNAAANMPPPPSTRKKGVTFCDDLPSHKRGGGGEQAQPAAHANGKEEQEEEEKEDPWKLLDPHVAATEKKHQPRPLVVGMTLQLPRGVTELPSEAIAARAARNNNSTQDAKGRKKLVVPRIKEETTNDNSRTWAVDTFRANLKRAAGQQTAAGQQQQQQPSSFLEKLEDEDDIVDQPQPIPLTGLFYGNEFEYIARATAKRKAAARREMLQQQQEQEGQSQQQQQRQSRNRHEPKGNVQQTQPPFMHNDDDHNDDDDDGGFGMGDHDDGDDDDVDFGGAGGLDGDNDTDNNNNTDGKPKEIVTNTGLTLVDQAYHTTTALDDDNDSTMNDRHFAALCRARIESFARGAEKYASDTNLSKRVEKWQSKVKPMLENEERRPVFDIHVYSQRILTSMEQDLENQRAAKDDENMKNNEDVAAAIHETKGNPLVDFATVTQDCEQYDVCRMFLATLSLCNAGNIIVQQQHIDSSSKPYGPSGGGPRLGTLRLELLKSDISQPMDTYLDFGN